MAHFSEHSPAPLPGEQAVVWAALPMDGALTIRILNEAGIPCKVITNLESLESIIEERVSTVIMAAEILTMDRIARLKNSFARHRPWSELAVIIMAGTEASKSASTWIKEIYESFHQVIFMARPVAIDTFVGIVKGTLLEQRRHYDVRALMERNEQELTWRRSVEASLRLVNQQLSTSEARYRRLLDTANEGILTLAGTGRIDYVNRRMAEMLGYSPNELQGRFLQDILKTTGHRNGVQKWFTAGADPCGQEECEFRRKDGSRLVGIVSHSLIDSATGEGAGFFVMVTDITGRREMEDRFRQIHAELDAARQAAEAANRAKGAFLANLSHEIRTPICAMVGFSELLNDVHLEVAERRGYCNIIARNGAQLVALIDDILDLSKIEAGFLQIERVNTSLASLLTDVKNALAIKAMHKGITLTLDVNEGMPELILTDPTRLRQILLNIIGNAIKFTNQGSVKVSVSYRWPDCDTPGELKFTVEDTGCGITEEGQVKLFMPFSQADTTTTRKFGGTGLGLALSKRLALSLGGDVILAWSEPGQGSRFIATIVAPPIAMKSSQVEASGPLVQWPGAGQNQQPLTGLHILLAEDAVDSQVLITQFLKIAGATVDIVNNGAEAVDKAMHDGYDVVLMDVQMPILDGYGATALLRSRGYVGPIIALTAHAMLGEKEKSLQAGCDYHLVKPIDRAHLVNTVALFSGRTLSKSHEIL